MRPLGIIGFGNMGEAFAAGLLKKVPDMTIIVAEKNKDRAQYAMDRYGVARASSYKELCRLASILLLAVKPQDCEETCSALKPYLKGLPLISILAGTTKATLSRLLDTESIVRFMPNLAAAYGRAAVGFSAAPEIDESVKEECTRIASAVGKPIELSEHLFSAFTGLSGSGIAYMFHILHAFALGGTAAGVPYPTALSIALETMEGAVTAVKESGESPTTLLSRVISPGGTTIQGVRVLEKEKVTAGIMEAISAAAKQAEEMEKTSFPADNQKT
jgi:pyrroline-5-carboxylate reductase